MLNVNSILLAMHNRQVDCILIGGMNYLLNHQPVLTYDVDLWVETSAANRVALNDALKELGSQWGATESAWGPVPDDPAWLRRQSVFCLTTTAGALDIFFEVCGLENLYAECRRAALPKTTREGAPYFSLRDEHMLACQEALSEPERKQQRMEVLRASLAGKSRHP